MLNKRKFSVSEEHDRDSELLVEDDTDSPEKALPLPTLLLSESDIYKSKLVLLTEMTQPIQPGSVLSQDTGTKSNDKQRYGTKRRSIKGKLPVLTFLRCAVDLPTKGSTGTVASSRPYYRQILRALKYEMKL